MHNRTSQRFYGRFRTLRIVNEQPFTNHSIRLLKSKKPKVVVNMINNLSVSVESCPEFLNQSYGRILPMLADLMKNTSETSIRLDVINFFRAISKKIDDEGRGSTD